MVKIKNIKYEFLPVAAVTMGHQLAWWSEENLEVEVRSAKILEAWAAEPRKDLVAVSWRFEDAQEAGMEQTRIGVFVSIGQAKRVLFRILNTFVKFGLGRSGALKRVLNVSDQKLKSTKSFSGGWKLPDSNGKNYSEICLWIDLSWKPFRPKILEKFIIYNIAFGVQISSSTYLVLLLTDHAV